MARRITLKNKKKQVLNKKFAKDFQRAIDRGSYVYLQDKDIQKKAKKILGYSQDMLDLLVETAKDKSYEKTRQRIEKTSKKTREKQKLKERKRFVTNLDKLNLTHDSKQRIISDTSLGLAKFVGGRDAETNIRKELINKMNDLFFGTGTGKGILKGAFSRQLNKKLIDDFVSDIEEFIMTSKNAVTRVSEFYENIDKYFEYIYEENMVEKGYYQTGQHSVEMKYVLEDLLATFKSGIKY